MSTHSSSQQPAEIERGREGERDREREREGGGRMDGGTGHSVDLEMKMGIHLKRVLKDNYGRAVGAPSQRI